MRSRLNKKSKSPISKLKEKLWKLCREIVILRHGSTCYTCGAAGLSGSNRQVGHFIPSSVCSVEMRYSLDNLRIQCFRCNMHLSGNWIAYEEHLKKDGYNVAALKKKNETTKGRQYDNLWYQNKIKEYEEILEKEPSSSR